MLTSASAKALCLYLIIALMALSLPAETYAMFIPADPTALSRTQDMNKIQKVLESTIIRQRLQDYGLSAEEAAERLAALPDEKVHQFAAQLDAVQAGGDILGEVIFLLLVVLIIIVILELTNHRVIVRGR